MMSKNFDQTSEILNQESRCDMNLPFPFRNQRHLLDVVAPGSIAVDVPRTKSEGSDR